MRKYDEHTALGQYYQIERFAKDGTRTVEDLALRRAMNEAFAVDAYVEDCEKVVRGRNRVLKKAGLDGVLRLPQ